MTTANPFEEELCCSVCFDIFKEPHILRECFHTFCHQCIKKLEHRGRVQCPECRVITESEHIKKDFKTQRLIDVYNNQNETSKGKPLKRKCGMCKKSDEVKSHCSECEHYMCADCEEIHKSMKLARGHNVKQIKEIIKGYESILNKDIDELKKQMRNANEKSSKFSKGIDNVAAARKKQLTDLKLFTENAKKELDENQIRLEQVINEANDNLIRQLTKGKEISNESKTEIQNKIDFINQMIRAQDIDTLSDSTSSVDKATKADIEKIKASLDKTDMCMDSPVSVEKGKDWDAYSCVSVKIDGVPHHNDNDKDHLEMTYTDLHKYKYTLDKRINLEFSPYKLCEINSELWCAGGDGIYVYTKDCQLIKKITHKQITSAFGLTHCSNTGDVAVACGGNNGLHQLDDTGKHISLIAEGSYSDAYYYNKFLYALDIQKFKVAMFKNSYTGWSQIKTYDQRARDNLVNCNIDRIGIHTSGIYVSLFHHHQICKYNSQGHFVEEMCHQKTNQSTKISYPILCSIYQGGEILLADFGNMALKIVHVDGCWYNISLPDIESRPMHAVVGEGGFIWMITQQPSKLMKFIAS